MILPTISVLLYVVAIVLFGRLHRVDQTVNWLRDPVSNYGAGRHAPLFRVYGHVGTAAALLLAVQFFQSRAPVFPLIVLVSMTLLLGCRIGVILVPTDVADGPATRTGRLHLVLAVATFACTYTAIANATPVLPTTIAPPAVACLVALRHVAMVSLIAVVVTMLPPAKALFGLAERVFLVSTMGWFLVCNVWFIAAQAA